MWQRFTENARKVVFYAQEEAGAVGQNQVGPEHLLAGLLRNKETSAVKLLVKLSISPKAIQTELARRMVRESRRSPQDMQLTKSAKQVIDKASDEARRLNSDVLGTEHLLLGLLSGSDFSEPENLATQILNEFGADLEAAREVVRELQSAKSAAPSKKRHRYEVKIDWAGNDGDGTRTYQSYRRDHTISSNGKPIIDASSDPAFRGDSSRYNPEELLVASLSSCHMLWYLHLCSANGVVVLEYQDEAFGIMEEAKDGSGVFTRVVLRPNVKISDLADAEKARSLHHEAHEMCFIARSVNFPVEVVPTINGIQSNS